MRKQVSALLLTNRCPNAEDLLRCQRRSFECVAVGNFCGNALDSDRMKVCVGSTALMIDVHKIGNLKRIFVSLVRAESIGNHRLLLPECNEKFSIVMPFIEFVLHVQRHNEPPQLIQVKFTLLVYFPPLLQILLAAEVIAIVEVRFSQLVTEAGTRLLLQSAAYFALLERALV